MAARLLFALLALIAATASATEEKWRFERELMGTRFVVACFAGDKTTAAKAADAAFALAEEVCRAASDHDPASELSRLSGKPAGTAQPVSPLLFGLLDHSRRLAEATDGAFDPTLGPLTKLWREAGAQGRLPDPGKLAKARESVGWREFSLNPEGRTVTFHRENMAFDLGGIAKGHTADLMLETLAKAGITRAMIAAGGDIRLGDPPPGREGWTVALQTFDLSRPDEMLVLANCAVSTSGDLHRFVEVAGVRHSHILDPATGLGLTRRVAASVIACEAKWSDPLATAACVLGPEGSETLRKLPGVRELKLRTTP